MSLKRLLPCRSNSSISDLLKVAERCGSFRKAADLQAQADAERAISAVERLGPAITSDSLRRFALAARSKLRNEDGTYRRDHLRALAQRVEVVDPSEIRILGTKTELLRTLVAAAGVESAAAGVRSFIPKWRTRHDSNV
jgi:site-specific DNA recombinase